MLDAFRWIPAPSLLGLTDHTAPIQVCSRTGCGYPCPRFAAGRASILALAFRLALTNSIVSVDDPKPPSATRAESALR